MKTITLLTTLIMMTFFSLSVLAGESHLDHAIQHAETAAKSADGKAVAKHAMEAKKHANAAKNDKDRQIDTKHLDEGIKSLDEAVKEGKDGEADAAKKAASDAIEHFKQASK
ncbi:Small metal-binding protein [Nitrosomonas ureae]|uniref:Small metal-binding protein n=1 Tax=Nitrosomonas ureae TaxID=44577 RepID=A0A285C0Q4_9PROT|nr:small metal-binding protein SmbP [Nitrosomonas ureae]SNX61151.1 Small metal-binding protein [Nitrosomonas ureae]